MSNPRISIGTFQVVWYKQYSWVVLCETKAKAFCFHCRFATSLAMMFTLRTRRDGVQKGLHAITKILGISNALKTLFLAPANFNIKGLGTRLMVT